MEIVIHFSFIWQPFETNIFTNVAIKCQIPSWHRSSCSLWMLKKEMWKKCALHVTPFLERKHQRLNTFLQVWPICFSTFFSYIPSGARNAGVAPSLLPSVYFALMNICKYLWFAGAKTWVFCGWHLTDAQVSFASWKIISCSCACISRRHWCCNMRYR